jgi:hypothetical protein
VKLTKVHYAGFAAFAVIAWFLASRVFGQDSTGGFNAPPKQAVPDDDVAEYLNPHPDYPVICGRDDHHAGYVYTPHRFPVVVGGEITAAIHRGFSPMRVPNVADAQWIIAPPSEVMF